MSRITLDMTTMEAMLALAEGYRANGDSGIAIKLGSAEGKNFAEACKNFYQTLQPSQKRWYYLVEGVPKTFWGCRLFDNEAAARQSFG